MSDNCLMEGQLGQEDFGPLEPEDDLDAFNDETFGDGLGDAWQEDAHEKLAVADAKLGNVIKVIT